MINDLILTDMKTIDVEGGSVLRVLRSNSNEFKGFGEAYFSTVKYKITRGWKCHKKMTLNIVVPMGSIRFVVYDGRNSSSTFGNFQEFILSRSNYNRLTIPPGVWVGFQGVGVEDNILLNIANIPHDDNEVDHVPLEEFDYNWNI